MAQVLAVELDALTAVWELLTVAMATADPTCRTRTSAQAHVKKVYTESQRFNTFDTAKISINFRKFCQSAIQDLEINITFLLLLLLRLSVDL